MVVSVQLAELGARSAPGSSAASPNSGTSTVCATPRPVTAAPLSGQPPAHTPAGPRRPDRRLGGRHAFDAFLAEHPLARRLSSGWQVRLQPLHVYGSWPEMPGLPSEEIEVGDEEPVAVLTLGRLRLRRLGPSCTRAPPPRARRSPTRQCSRSTGLARPPRLVSTFSLWRDVGAMREYAGGHRDGAHPAATRAHRQRSFHHESAFIRFRPYASQGEWDGRDPLEARLGGRQARISPSARTRLRR